MCIEYFSLTQVQLALQHCGFNKLTDFKEKKKQDMETGIQKCFSTFTRSLPSPITYQK